MLLALFVDLKQVLQDVYRIPLRKIAQLYLGGLIDICTQFPSALQKIPLIQTSVVETETFKCGTRTRVSETNLPSWKGSRDSLMHSCILKKIIKIKKVIKKRISQIQVHIHVFLNIFKNLKRNLKRISQIQLCLHVFLKK